VRAFASARCWAQQHRSIDGFNRPSIGSCSDGSLTVFDAIHRIQKSLAHTNDRKVGGNQVLLGAIAY
jgi:hypothetical protein